jgi:Fe(II)/alpha-ketoglutarate-dependent arginine beta-hydroxylase
VKIGPTPEHWQLEPEISPVLREEILLILFGSLLGEPIAWATQQKGHIVHDIMPIKGMEQEQLGTGSEQLLWWHNEDAFHPYRGDYLSMMCLRNPDKVATTLASIDTVELSEEQIKLLFEPQFVIRPDESHLKKNAAQIDGDESAEDLLCSAYQGIERMNSAPEKISVLYGSPSSPYLRIDPYFMDAVDDEAAQSALDALIKSIDEVLVDVVLKPGELLFIDNYKTVHGRKPFKAKYDGNDRWLKRINITKDLRKSRNARTSCLSRVIY